MSHIFNLLTNQEIALLRLAIPQITILIAGADGVIDEKERAWAEKITGIRTYKASEGYQKFYTEVSKEFQSKLDAIISTLPKDSKERGIALSEELAKLNPVLAKLTPKVGAKMYNEFKSFANHVAKSHGGFLGFFSVGSEEAKFVNLPMLTPIEYDETLDEEE